MSNQSHRSFVGPIEKYDLVAAMQFHLMTQLGLREYHKLLDIGCGSLRAGRLFIPYLHPGNYYGIEPEEWLLREGISHELGSEIVELKRASFICSYDFPADQFGATFNYAIAQSIFSHTSQKQISLCLKNLSCCLDAEGLFVASFVRGDQDYKGTEWVYPGCVTYSVETLDGLATEHGLRFKVIEWPHPNGQTWGVFARKRALDRLVEPTDLGLPIHTQDVHIEQYDEQVEDIVGWLDNCSPNRYGASICGWAYNFDPNSPIKHIVILDSNNRVVATARVNIQRVDVMKSLNRPEAEVSGWEVTITLPPGEHELAAYAYFNHQRRAIRIPGSAIVMVGD